MKKDIFQFADTQLSLLFFMMAMFVPLPFSAQDSLTIANKLRGGDKVVRQRINPIPSGGYGENVFWDFRDMQVLGEEVMTYEGDSLLAGIGRKTIERYIVNDDGLWQTGWESALERMEYAEPVCMVRYPMTYGDSLCSSFSGKGRYCDLYDVDVNGTQEVEADAYGTMLVGEGDTLRHVFRLHTVRFQSMAMDTPPSKRDSTLALRLQIEDQYSWFVRGYRYPVMQLFSRASYYKSSLVSTYQTAYRCLPDAQRLAFADSTNEAIAREDSVSSLPLRQNFFHYVASVFGSDVVVDFDLDEDAQMMFLLSDVRGVLYRKKVFSEVKGKGYQARINCSGLQAGDYILYMNANGQIYSEKIRWQH